MEVLRTTKKTTEEFMVKVQELKNKYKVKQLAIKEKLLTQSQEQIRKFRNNDKEESIGDPTEFCNILTRLKVEFDQLKIDHKEEEEKIMKKYVQKMTIYKNMVTCVNLVKSEEEGRIQEKPNIKLETNEK
jgi:hypothetical protein